MKKQYCVTVLGEFIADEVISDLKKICDTNIKTIITKGLFIGTFGSDLPINEITRTLKKQNKTFLAFEVKEGSSSYNIGKKGVTENLFGDDNKVKEKMAHVDRLFNDELKIKEPKVGTNLTRQDIEKMSRVEKDEMMNTIIDKGLDNLSVYHKEILPLLAK